MAGQKRSIEILDETESDRDQKKNKLNETNDDALEYKGVATIVPQKRVIEEIYDADEYNEVTEALEYAEQQKNSIYFCGKEYREQQLLKRAKIKHIERLSNIIDTESQLPSNYKLVLSKYAECYIKSKYDRELSDVEISSLIKEMGYKSNDELSEIQNDGIRFALRKFLLTNSKGCIIAAEMGLGKTLMTLCIERIYSKTNKKRTSLILTPAGLTRIWVEESLKFFGNSIKLLVYESDKSYISYGGKSGSDGAKTKGKVSKALIKKYDIVITHFQSISNRWKETVKNPVKEYNATLTEDKLSGTDKVLCRRNAMKDKFPFLDWSQFKAKKCNSDKLKIKVKSNGQSIPMVGDILGFHWGLIIIDEAHNIKNPTTLLASMCHAMRAEKKLALTGTPTLNRLQESWSLFRFLEVQGLGNYKGFEEKCELLSKELTQEVSRRKILGKADESDEKEQFGQAAESIKNRLLKPNVFPTWNDKSIKHVLDLIEDWMYRITKNEVAKSKKTKEEIEHEVDMFKKDGWKLIKHSLDSIPPAYEKTVMIDPHPLLTLVHDMFRNGKRDEFKTVTGRAKASFIQGVLTHLRMLVSFPGSISNDVLEKYCDEELVEKLMSSDNYKMKEFLKYYESDMKPNDQKAIIYTFFKETGKYIKSTLNSMNIGTVYVDGDVNADNKLKICTDFSEGTQNRVLVGTHCIGTGFNITGANHVVLWDEWWNGAEDEQCFSRTLRVGQLHPVKVLRLIQKGTIEEKMLQISLNKAFLTGGISKNGGSINKKLLGFQ